MALFLITAMSLPFVFTGAVIIHFQLERDRIIRELCVQRSLPEGMRTCHGQCHLKKRLQAEAPQHVPAPPRLELRIEPAIPFHARAEGSIREARTRSFEPERAVRMSAGYPFTAEPVPWPEV